MQQMAMDFTRRAARITFIFVILTTAIVLTVQKDCSLKAKQGFVITKTVLHSANQKALGKCQLQFCSSKKKVNERRFYSGCQCIKSLCPGTKSNMGQNIFTLGELLFSFFK